MATKGLIQLKITLVYSVCERVDSIKNHLGLFCLLMLWKCCLEHVIMHVLKLMFSFLVCFWVPLVFLNLHTLAGDGGETRSQTGEASRLTRRWAYRSGSDTGNSSRLHASAGDTRSTVWEWMRGSGLDVGNSTVTPL